MTKRWLAPALTPSLCKAARGYLDWNQRKLAEAAKLSVNAVRNYERTGQPDAPRGTSLETIVKIQQALEDAGFSFESAPSETVMRWRRP